ncbi:MAG TPA: cytochrome o ubiquinol oxidase subunit IV [Candidatus Saccharimonadales bacterium]
MSDTPDDGMIISGHATDQGTLRSYVTGFAASIILTLIAYLFVVHHWLSRRGLIALVAGLALAQFLTQALFFLHLGREAKPRWKLAVFIFMVGVVCILVFGSLWIMSNLNYRMTPDQIRSYLKNQDGI